MVSTYVWWGGTQSVQAGGDCSSLLCKPLPPDPGPSRFQHSLLHLLNSSQSPSLFVWGGREFYLSRYLLIGI